MVYLRYLLWRRDNIIQSFMNGYQNTHLIPDWVYSKMTRYCSYQERCIFDVKTKLQQYHLQEEVYDAIINKLIAENYLNEERFARVFAGGKFRINKWGRNKIYRALQQKRVPEFYILSGMNEIDDGEYRQVLQQILEQKSKGLNEPDPLKRKHKLSAHAVNKGYEVSLVKQLIENL